MLVVWKVVYIERWLIRFFVLVKLGKVLDI